MRIENLDISKRLSIGFAIILVFILLISLMAYLQADLLFSKIEEMYNHPLQVRRAIDFLIIDISEMRIYMRDLLTAEGEDDRQSILQRFEMLGLDVENQFEIIHRQYLGPEEDVHETLQNYTLWKKKHEEIIRLVNDGEMEKAKAAFLENEDIEGKRAALLSSLDTMDVFAQNKADSLYNTSADLNRTLNIQILIVMLATFLVSLAIIYFLIRSVKNPLGKMNSAILRFHNGDMNARSSYESKNEFGILSSSINRLAEQIQEDSLLNQQTLDLSAIMLQEEDDKKFFQMLLVGVSERIGAQMSAVYLFNAATNTYDHFESIGTSESVKQSFAADNYEGEFGASVVTRKLQYIKDISEDSHLILQTINGRIWPKEIITVPIVSENRVIAILSFATVSKFSSLAVKLLERANAAMNSRIEGILSNQLIKEYKDILENQNIELDKQKNELAAQTSELSLQNTELETQKNRLNEASKMKTSFLSNMSHELRTPLNSVIALSGLLNRKLEHRIPEEEYAYLEIIERNGKNLLRLINEVLDISRIESGREEIVITEFNINSLITDVAATLNPQAEQKHIALIHTSSEQNMQIRSDADKCRHIMMNLVGNAVKFTEKGSVTVSVEQKDKTFEIKVVDTGIGIDEEHLPYIFDEFRQADGSTSRRFGGTGLGLAIAKKYANMLGGDIKVKSEPDKGSEFVLTLPMDFGGGPSANKKDNAGDYFISDTIELPDSAETEPGKNILLVDDNESAVIQIRALLEEMGHNVEVAKDAGEAFSLIDTQIPDAMILDLMMPDIDGFRVLELLRNAKITAHIPVMILTAKHVTRDELKFLKRNNIHQLIQKGDINREKLQSAINSMFYLKSNKAKEPRKETPSPKERPVILVVEDNPDNMVTIKALLFERYSVVEAVNGRESIELAKKHMPSLILMDIALPDISGIQAYKEIRKITKLIHVPVIALTASAMEHDREAILSHGFDAFIAKPIIEKDFNDIINEVLHGR